MATPPLELLEINYSSHGLTGLDSNRPGTT